MKTNLDKRVFNQGLILAAYNVVPLVILACLLGCGSVSPSAGTPPEPQQPSETFRMDDGRVLHLFYYDSDFRRWMNQNTNVTLHSVSRSTRGFSVVYTPAKKPAEKEN